MTHCVECKREYRLREALPGRLFCGSHAAMIQRIYETGKAVGLFWKLFYAIKRVVKS